MLSAMMTVSRRNVLRTAAGWSTSAFSAWAAESKTSIWDLHCHLGASAGTPTEKLAALIRVADRMVIERLCVYMGFPFDTDPAPETLRAQNNQVLEAIGRFPQRTFGFVYLNPKHLQFSLDEFNRCVRDGPMVGVKLWVAQRANAPALDPIIERAGALGAVIFQHTWFKTGGNPPG